MEKRRRLRENADFQRLRREGRTLAQPLVVASFLPNGLGYTRFGFAVGKRIGKAVVRNRVKRRMREAVRRRLQEGQIVEGWDIVLIARRPIVEASFQQVDATIGLLLRRASLVREVS
jgi:ribonuclease P protein component